MPIDATTPIRQAPSGAAWTAILALDRPEQHDYDYIQTVFAEAPALGIDPAIVVAQWSHETAMGTSVRWNRDHNPAGIGISQDDSPQPFPVRSGTEAALVHLAALDALLTGQRGGLWRRLSPEAIDWFERVWLPHCRDAIAYNARVNTIGDLNIRYPDRQRGPHATWAWDPDYAAGVLRHHARLFPVDPPLPIEQRIAPLGQRNTPNVPLNANGDLWITVHENGNPGANAYGEAGFVAGGGGEDLASYHFAVDPDRAVQILPLDRIGYHAADGCDNRAADLGCFQSIAIETCQTAPVGSPGWERTLRNLVRLIVAVKTGDGRIAYGQTNPARFRNGQLAQHNRWYPRKNCPERIRNTGRWQGIVWAVELALRPPATVPQPTPQPEPVAPALPRGMSRGLVKRLFNPWNVTDPRTGKPAAFDPGDSVARAWLARAVASIPAGAHWSAGAWEPLFAVIRRGDGRLVFAFAGGWVYELEAGREAA
jgi:hypothetical protein